MEKVKLVNNIDTIIKINKNTPRIALCFYFAINEPEKKAGVYTLMNRLFMQGTHSRTAEEIAESLEGNAIECTSEMKYDYFKFRLLCLNEDFEKGLEILSDIIKNSTFKDLNKEVFKIKGELTAELDSPKTSASDNFYKTIFKNHFYGNTYTKILENVDNIEINDIEEAYKNVILNSHKTITVVGDKDQQEIIGLLEKYFSGLTQDTENKNSIVLLETQKKEVVKIEKNDAAQAQVLQGWIVPSLYSEEYATFVVLNTILGACGLSSRLFLELRDKKGLAYTVRSNYETYSKGACFSVYIGTEPKNIKVALAGFKEEIDKIKTELVSDLELENAKNSIIGKRLFLTETNMQQANMAGLYEIENLGYDYESKLIEKIKKVKKEDIQNIAKKYLNENAVLSILAPHEYLSEL